MNNYKFVSYVSKFLAVTKIRCPMLLKLTS